LPSFCEQATIASVNRALNQLVSVGIIHKQRIPEKGYVFHINVDFLELCANSIEKIMGVYKTQKNEINNITQKLTAIELERKEQAEIKRLRTVKKFRQNTGTYNGSSGKHG
jgi:Fe2+ or Zn2+ uptake regulation protein